MLLDFQTAYRTLIDRVRRGVPAPSTELVSLEQARGRFLAEDVLADRDYPPFPRATRDGFALRADDVQSLPGKLELLGEARAGSWYDGHVGPGQAVRIMTGAPVPEGADAVVMVEHTQTDESGRVMVEKKMDPGTNIVPKGSEAAQGTKVLLKGKRLGAGEIGLLASVGRWEISVARRPRIAILPTGDEIVPPDREPEWYQIRNSNAAALGAQISVAGGEPVQLGIGPDQYEPLKKMVQKGLEEDLLVVSGGVSVGKYDIVEKVLVDLGAEFHFTGVALRPGKPLVFGQVGRRFFFGVPGNPVSTFVTFEMFVRSALEILCGAPSREPTFLRACLASTVSMKGGLTAFVPARLFESERQPVVELVPSEGSGDLVGLAKANCFVVVHPEQTMLPPGTWVDIYPKP